VKETAISAIKLEFIKSVEILESHSKPVNPETAKSIKTELLNMGIKVTN
jgi:hypothetical protein